MYYMDNRLLFLAVIPGVLILLYVYGKDKVEKEPVSIIARLVLFGGASCIVAGTAEALLQSVLPQYERGTIEFALQTSFCLAALCEETVKYLALRIGTWKSSHFNYRFDGIVYGASAAIGFAVFENIQYVASFGLATAITRAFLAVPLHAFCGVFMGVFYSYSKKSAILGLKGKQFLFTVLSLIVPMLIHGIYDTLAFMGTQQYTVMLLVFVVLLYIAAITTIRKMSAADREAGFYPRARTIEYDTTLTD
jgi:RsiW-degrading membrane proteinase PrsW (M82 family)